MSVMLILFILYCLACYVAYTCLWAYYREACKVTAEDILYGMWAAPIIVPAILFCLVKDMIESPRD